MKVIVYTYNGNMLTHVNLCPKLAFVYQGHANLFLNMLICV